MKEHPILFSGDMAKAILEGRKTQTRRVIKNPKRLEGLMLKGEEGEWCPYGKLGERLWVKEAFCYAKMYGYDAREDGGEFWYKATDSGQCEGPYKSSRFMPKWAARIWLEITGLRVEQVQDISPDNIIAEGLESMGWDYAESSDGTGDKFMYWSDPTKNMPKWCPQNTTSCECIEDVFSWLWDSLNAKRGYGWDKNPWVWCITFKKI